MTEHVEKTRLINDLRYRFDYISKFVNFTQYDIDLLNHLAPIIFPLLPNIVEKIYKKLYSFDITKNYFLQRNDGFETFSPNQQVGTTLLSVQTDYRKDMLTIFFKNVLSQNDWNDTFLQYLSRVGEIHTPRGGSASINVDYLHINVLLSVLEDTFIEIIWHLNDFDQNKKLDAFRAVNKFFWIQNDFFTMQYGLSNNQKSLSNVAIVNFSKCCFR